MPIRVAEISRALAQQQTSLLNVLLHFSYQDQPLTLYRVNHEWSTMTFLDFEKLQHLSICFGLFFGCPELEAKPEPKAVCRHALDSLPDSLETLAIVQCQNEAAVAATADIFDEMICYKSQKFPRLQALRMNTCDKLDAKEDSMHDVFEAATKSARALFEARNWANAAYPTIELVEIQRRPRLPVRKRSRR